MCRQFWRIDHKKINYSFDLPFKGLVLRDHIISVLLKSYKLLCYY